jgi:hypothetical protein
VRPAQLTTDSLWCRFWIAVKINEQLQSNLVYSAHGAIAQLGERIVRNDEVVGSIPTSSTKSQDSQDLNAHGNNLDETDFSASN